MQVAGYCGNGVGNVYGDSDYGDGGDDCYPVYGDDDNVDGDDFDDVDGDYGEGVYVDEVNDGDVHGDDVVGDRSEVQSSTTEEEKKLIIESRAYDASQVRTEHKFLPNPNIISTVGALKMAPSRDNHPMPSNHTTVHL